MTVQTTRLSQEQLADIQGFITSGYGHAPYAVYLFVQFLERRQAQQWLRQISKDVTSARAWPTSVTGEKVKPEVTLNLAFTSDGLTALGISAEALCSFPLEFQQGMAHEDRSRILGDTDASHPREWEIGGPSRPPIHAVILLHAVTTTALDDACNAQRMRFAEAAGGVIELQGSMQRGYRPEGDYEPFGFHDGLSQPAIAGLGGEGIPTGEFILGYLNHYNILPETPVVAQPEDPDGLLPPLDNPYHSSGSFRDFGANGSFVVYRKLQQDVEGFWGFMKSEALRLKGTENVEYAIWLASRCVGRWPSGAPLVLAPEADDAALGERNDFLYRDDPDGFACPIGAHIRRTHPRDDLKPYPAAESRSMADAHRLLRRARVFGAKTESQGIHFFAVNASIRSQFEFVQQTWANNPHFGGLHDNKDPIIGDNGRTGASSSRMTIPARPVPVRTAALPRFVTVLGGAYLFMPSLKALQFLGSCSPASSRDD